MHRRQIGGKCYKVQLLLNKKEEIIAKRFKIVLAEKKNLQEAAESQETPGKTSRNKNNKGGARNKSKKSWIVLQVMHGGGVEVGLPEMSEVPTEPAQKKDRSK